MLLHLKGAYLPDKPGDPWVPTEEWIDLPEERYYRHNVICKLCKLGSSENYPNCIEPCEIMRFKPTEEDMKEYYEKVGR